MLLNEIRPNPFLAEYIRLYRIVDFTFPGNFIIPPKLYSPRPEHCVQFYPKDTETVLYPDNKKIISNKKITITGQHVVVNNRRVGKDFLCFQIVFHPGAFYRITGIGMQELTNVYMDTEDIFGCRLRYINEQLAGALSYGEMIKIAERFLSELIKRVTKEKHSVDKASKLMLLQNEHFNLDRFINDSFICHRQFDRKFKERVGIPPKQFLQIIRFDKAFRLKNKNPHLDWLSVALRCGYYDYQHLAKDYKQFTGYTPPQFFTIDNQAPERCFGDAEI